VRARAKGAVACTYKVRRVHKHPQSGKYKTIVKNAYTMVN